MEKIITEICERLARLETQVKHIFENDMPHLRDDMKSIKRWIWGLYGSVTIFFILAVIKWLTDP